GPHWGFLMGWGYWGAYIFISGYVTLGFGGYLHALTGLPPVAGALALIGISTGINLVGVRLSGVVQSLVIGVAIVVLLAFVALGTLPWNELGRSPAPLAAAATQFLGSTGRQLTALAAILTTAATGNAVLVVTSRVAFAMARDGALPGVVARVHPTTGVPWAAGLLNGIL